MPTPGVKPLQSTVVSTPAETEKAPPSLPKTVPAVSLSFCEFEGVAAYRKHHPINRLIPRGGSVWTCEGTDQAAQRTNSFRVLLDENGKVVFAYKEPTLDLIGLSFLYYCNPEQGICNVVSQEDMSVLPDKLYAALQIKKPYDWPAMKPLADQAWETWNRESMQVD